MLKQGEIVPFVSPHPQNYSDFEGTQFAIDGFAEKPK